MTLRSRRENRMEQIVDTAAHLFAEKGYHGASIQDLVDGIGLQRGALYHYIDGKKDLLFEIHKRFIEPLLDEARAIEGAGLPADLTLRALAHALMSNIDRYRDQVTVFLHEWKIIRDDPKWQSVRETRRAFEAVVERVLERGVKEGVFRLSDVRLATLAFLGMINYGYQWFDPRGRASANEVADYFCSIFLKGVRS